ncbi:hypothetical protein EOC93_02520 [Mesorhizobium sp. M6A.T.Ce.TU.002.03.1.1]|uniref:OmpA family protein n=1 Tax=unclassified Mesorhizobium TaxID=325217 RepID=UPI000F75330B|nr:MULTISPECIES: OmpA family protein [unclassified Mesorhizobium]AZO66241.1 hypothetical protein EJ075_15490 [Mesorhizobium sp. M6A.T.Cr.TU.016.01.1.1]RUU46653.1 hypothetical protein EOC93_02520 [Mesorhizobium sp. M6A.T.Ce.TU.002.03.1.1]RWP76794.1 MAG: hypothetical protein EOR09_09695 [Mesorhizobium sp.]
MSEVGATSVAFERKGYGRGLILGLTMAETMLLLVFCLLLAAGAMIAKKERETAEAQKLVQSVQEKARKLDEENKRLLAQLNEMAKSPTGGNVPDQQWRELVLAKDAIDRIKMAGLTAEEVIKRAPVTKVLSENDFDVAQAKVMIEHMKVLKEYGYVGAGKTPKDLSDALKKANASAVTAKPHDWPPIINLSELDGYNFDTGSAELSDRFKTRLRDLSKTIAGIATSYGVDVIEVIGHTDEQAMSGQSSNMDKGLQPVLAGKVAVGALHPADNAGLGLARAISVTSILRDMPELQGFTILPMSGGQLILPGDRLTDGAQAGDVKARRRIEIRVRQRSRETDLAPAQGLKS